MDLPLSCDGLGPLLIRHIRASEPRTPVALRILGYHAMRDAVLPCTACSGVMIIRNGIAHSLPMSRTWMAADLAEQQSIAHVC